MPSDPAIDITWSLRQPQVAPSGCAEHDAIEGADDAVVDGTPQRGDLRWELLLLDGDGDFEIDGTVEGTAPGGCTFSGTVTGRYTLE